MPWRVLALLIIAAAVCIAWGSQITASMNSIWKSPILHSHPIAKAVAFLRGNSDHGTVSVVSADGSKQSASSPQNQAAFAGTDESAQLLMEEDPGSIIIQPPQETITRISALINSGKLQTAKAETRPTAAVLPRFVPHVRLAQAMAGKRCSGNSGTNVQGIRNNN